MIFHAMISERVERFGYTVDGRYTRFAGIGFAFVALISAFTVGGYFIDRWAGTMPLFVLVGLVLGFAAALYYLFVKLKELGGG
ncbi:Putative F0F1-ATPase subunit (ATPase_gene1) [Rubrobacter radiotolerans]|nr:Putative F0F1-ATPase subunit (ATPase_gene1) [Rubrobacter radiotolerans]SMC05625.1 Putative F0F1-ATPase subunit Ca2+/Mg2+ transporter [Rubrobacter radiotolerans DSM 5868]